MSGTSEKFVEKMKEDTVFREKICEQGSDVALMELLEEYNFSFSLCELAKAMAECMDKTHKSRLA